MGKFVSYVVVIGFYLAIISSGACDVESARFQTTLRNEGIQQGVSTGYDFFECGYGDEWVSGFTGKVTRVKEGGGTETLAVKGTVCCGWIKGCTVRWP